MESFGWSETGKLREQNEDAIYCDDQTGVYIVADGMGGHQAGEVASREAIRTFLAAYEEGKKEEVTDRIISSMAKANEAVFQESLQEETRQGMGTTFTCAVVQGNRAVFGHVGDSRAYLYRKGTLRQITRDHSYVMEMVKQGKLTLEEAAVHPQRNVITRAIGTKEPMGSDLYMEEIKSGDRILLCSDGLTSMVDDAAIATILEEEQPVEQSARALAKTANENGGKDNISVILIQCEVEP